MKIIKWTTEDLELLKRYYPRMGKKWCMEAMCRTEASVRYKAAELGLKLDRESEFAKDFQSRAAKSKIGKKRPDQALVIKKLHAEGKLKKTNEQKEQMSQRVKRWHSLNPHPRGMLGKNHTEEALAKMRKPKSIPRQRVVCEHCGKEVTINTIGQHKRAYHNE